jgi:DNA-binding NarL/FixJ family response regulator
MQKITVLLCDDHAVVREGLRSLLDASGDIAVIGEAENGLRVVSEAIRLQPDAIESNRLPLLSSARSS